MSESNTTNRDAARSAFEAWQAGTAPITDFFAPDMTWRIEGHSLASREYPNTRAFIDEVLAPFGARFASGEPFRPVKIRQVLADGTWLSCRGTDAALPTTVGGSRTAMRGS